MLDKLRKRGSVIPGNGKIYVKPGTNPLFPFGRYFATKIFYNLLADGEAQSRTGVFGPVVEALKKSENIFCVFLVKSDSIVFKCDFMKGFPLIPGSMIAGFQGSVRDFLTGAGLCLFCILRNSTADYKSPA